MNCKNLPSEDGKDNRALKKAKSSSKSVVTTTTTSSSSSSSSGSGSSNSTMIPAIKMIVEENAPVPVKRWNALRGQIVRSCFSLCSCQSLMLLTRVTNTPMYSNTNNNNTGTERSRERDEEDMYQSSCGDTKEHGSGT